MEALLYFAFWAGLILLMMRFGCGAHVMGHGDHSTSAHEADKSRSKRLRWVPPEKDIDPVCGKTVKPDSAKSSVYHGSVYYFCSRDHREQFEAAPESYVGPKSQTKMKRLEDAHV